MLRFTTRVNTVIAGDFLIASKAVGGNCVVGPCDEKENCDVTCVIPSNRLEDFTAIVDERAAM